MGTPRPSLSCAKLPSILQRLLDLASSCGIGAFQSRRESLQDMGPLSPRASQCPSLLQLRSASVSSASGKPVNRASADVVAALIRCQKHAQRKTTNGVDGACCLKSRPPLVRPIRRFRAPFATHTRCRAACLAMGCSDHRRARFTDLIGSPSRGVQSKMPLSLHRFQSLYSALVGACSSGASRHRKRPRLRKVMPLRPALLSTRGLRWDLGEKGSSWSIYLSLSH